MKVKVVTNLNGCLPCGLLIEAINELPLNEPSFNASFEIFDKTSAEANLLIQEHLNRGFIQIGVPLWFLYDDEDNYVKTFLGFIESDKAHEKIKILKEALLLESSAFDHPTGDRALEIKDMLILRKKEKE
jgi:hypothetical protein